MAECVDDRSEKRPPHADGAPYTSYLAANCQLSTVNHFPSPQSLQELDVSYNRLQQLPESLGKLRNLYCLRASYNQLGILANEVWGSDELGVGDWRMREIGERCLGVRQALGLLDSLNMYHTGHLHPGPQLCPPFLHRLFLACTALRPCT